MCHCYCGDNFPTREIWRNLSPYSSPEAAKGILALTCRSSRQGWRWLPAPLSSNPGRRLDCSGSLQGEDNFACNFMKVWAFYMHFEVLQWDTILKVGFFSSYFCFVWSLAATPVFSLSGPFVRLLQSCFWLGTRSTLRFQMSYPKWLLDFSLNFPRGCCSRGVALVE